MATIDELIQRFDPANLERGVVSAINAFAFDVVDELQVYPPATDANRPGRFTPEGRPMGYYERGRGEWSPRVNKWALHSFGHFGKSFGVIRGSATQRQTGSVAGYILTSHSERLREKWVVERLSNGARITNGATYAPYVQSTILQSAVMARIGWETDRVALQKSWNAGKFQIALEQALRRFGIK